MGWPRGSVVMEAVPFAHVICQKFREERCNFCFQCSDNVKKCTACQKIWYCGVPCQKADWKIHKMECRILKRVPDSPTDSIRLFLRLVLRYLSGAASEKFIKDEKPCIRSFNDLMSHSDQIRQDSTRIRLFMIASDFLKGYTHGLLTLPNDDTLLEIFGKMVINTFTIADEMLQDVGVAVYNSPSVLDHCCWGNAVASFDGRKVVIRAVEDINSDSLSDVYLSYVDPLALTKERQDQLQEQYYFTCDCLRCQDTKADEAMCSTHGSNVADLNRVKACLESVEQRRTDGDDPKKILEACDACLNETKLPFGNVYLVRLLGKAFDVAIDAEEWEAALLLSIKNYKQYSMLHPQFSPCVGYMTANMGKLLMLVGRLPEALLHLHKAEENFSVSLGTGHFLYRQVMEMTAQTEAELANQGKQGSKGAKGQGQPGSEPTKSQG